VSSLKSIFILIYATLYYLCQGGYVTANVCAGVCFLWTWLHRKFSSDFLQNFVWLWTVAVARLWVAAIGRTI